MNDLSKYLPTAEIRKGFEEFKTLETEEEKRTFRERNKEAFEKMSEEEKAAYGKNMQEGLDAIGKRVDELYESVRLGEVAKLLSLAYISEKYFGKTRQWLYQRLNGYTVNGNPARFTDEEKTKLRQDLHDIIDLIEKT